MADIFTAYDMMFQQGLGSVTPTWSRIAMAAPSSGTTTKMPWLKNIPACGNGLASGNSTR